MKHLKKILFSLFALSLALSASSQEISTQGKEFWVSYMGNGYWDNGYPSYVDTQLLISSKRNCSGTIINPITGWTKTFNVAANNITSIDIPNEQAYNATSAYEVITTKGLQIITDDTVSVYCTNIASNSFDATYVLPVQALADDYIIQTYDQSTQIPNGLNLNQYLTSAFLIVGVEDNTTIDITPKVNTLGGHSAGQEFSITLHAGETYQVRSNNGMGSRDLTGSRVTARDCKKIAVFNGNTLTTVPNLSNGFDHIFEQAMPIRSWGKKFVVTQSSSRYRDYVKIVSASDDNVVQKNGETVATLQIGESYGFYLTSSQKSCYLETSGQSAVYLYNTTSSDDRGNGDPSMLWIAPVEQRLNEITFATFSGDEIHNSSISNHYINIIVATEDVDKVYFDGGLLSASDFETVTGNPNYSFIRSQISHSAHHITCVNGFNAHAYGFGDARGYAYLVGSKATDLSTTLIINNEIVAPNDTVSNCDLIPIRFEAEINFNNYELLWDFGDGTTSTDNPAMHSYTDRALYHATLTVTTEETPCQSSSSSTTELYIDSRREPDMHYTDEICAGQLYTGYGFNDILITNDTLLTRVQPNPDNPDCESTVSVDITILQAIDTLITDLVCYKGPDSYTDYGFDLYYDAPGQYTDSYITSNAFGCDRQYILDLTVSEILQGDTMTFHECDSVIFNSKTYYHSGQFTDTIPNENGCYTVIPLSIDLNYTPDPSPIYPVDTNNTAPHWVITATEFQINFYEYQLWDNNNNGHWDTVMWYFEDENLEWVLEPHGKRCKIYVLNYVEDTIWLDATAYNDCYSEGKTERYWLICSFYGTDETLGGKSDFSVSPNPNNGKMELKFEHLSGKIDLKVYDMRGTIIDQFEIFNNDETNTFHYDMKAKAEGVYFFVATHQKGSITRKIVITP